MIKILKLVTGELVICGFEETETTVTLKKAHLLLLTQNGGMAMIPWIFTNQEASFEISKTNVLVISDDVPKDLETHYVQATTGIELAHGGNSRIHV